MKIIRQFKMPDPETWWVGLRAECGQCWTKVQFEAGDMDSDPATGGVQVRRARDGKSIEWLCPSCKDINTCSYRLEVLAAQCGASFEASMEGRPQREQPQSSTPDDPAGK